MVLHKHRWTSITQHVVQSFTWKVFIMLVPVNQKGRMQLYIESFVDI